MEKEDNYYRVIESMLYDYKQVQAEIKNIDLDIEEILNNYIGVGSISYDKDKISPTNKFNSIVENIAAEREKALQYKKTLKRGKEIQIERINNMLSVLSDEEQKIIELRYFKKLQFKEIGDILCKSDIYLIQLRKKIISEKLIPFIKK